MGVVLVSGAWNGGRWLGWTCWPPQLQREVGGIAALQTHQVLTLGSGIRCTLQLYLVSFQSAELRFSGSGAPKGLEVASGSEDAAHIRSSCGWRSIHWEYWGGGFGFCRMTETAPGSLPRPNFLFHFYARLNNGPKDVHILLSENALVAWQGKVKVAGRTKPTHQLTSR